MEVRFHSNIDSVGRTPPQKPVAREAETARDEVTLENARALHRALEKTPDSRADMVERAAQLVGDVNYPPPETIQKISHLLALTLYHEQGEF
ncbi:MAG TPA: hypothetical protein VNO52_18125 [Methylomirabilota bacterium]|nr:hypothetical protein [Methylomirabilota bacterium]